MKPATGQMQTRWRETLAVAFMACACFAPLGIKYCAWLLLMGWLVARGPWASTGHAAHEDRPALHGRWLFAFASWMAVSAAWSDADARMRLTHGWSYVLPLLTLPLATNCPAPIALLAIRWFAVAAATVGLAAWSYSVGWVDASSLWSSTFAAEGNQRIVTSLLLALGCLFSLWLVTIAKTWPERIAWVAAALCAAAGLVSQDRRSGLVVLPILLAIWIMGSARRSLTRQLALAMGLLALLLGAAQIPGVQARFIEGWAEISAYRSSDDVGTSWGQRLRMYEVTLAMVAERPLLGHGLGSWKPTWDERVGAGSAVAVNTTPHNDLLLVAAQAGLPAAALLLGWQFHLIAFAIRRGADGIPAMAVAVTWLIASQFNVVMRDVKFALPLLLVWVFGLALACGDRRSPG